MATGTKACGWPLMANCILHSSFVNCCLPSSHFLLGHGTKPRTGGIRNGTSARPVHSQARSTSLSFILSPPLFVPLFLSLYLSVPIELCLLLSPPHCVHSHDLGDSFFIILSFFLSLLQSYFFLMFCELVFFTSLPHSLPVLFTFMQIRQAYCTNVHTNPF